MSSDISNKTCGNSDLFYVYLILKRFKVTILLVPITTMDCDSNLRC